MTATFVLEEQVIRIPSWVVDLESFRRWGRSDEFPERGRICYLGEIWVDTTMEQLFSHNQVKTELTIGLGSLAKENRFGTYFTDGASLSNTAADLSTVPDGLFVKSETFEKSEVILHEGARHGFVELEGTPDMVLEIVSDSSVTKDKTDLKKRYAAAGIAEYWIVDARTPPLEFTIYQLGKDGNYRTEPKSDQEDWVKSSVFGRSFRLLQKESAAGHPEFTLEIG